jgi:hypothetical protein
MDYDNPQKNITISRRSVFAKTINTIICTCLVVYYTYSYSIASSDLRQTTYFKNFLAFIIASWISLIIRFIILKQVIELWGITISKTIYYNLNYMNKFPCSFLKLSYYVSLMSGSYLTGIFLNFNNCNQNEMLDNTNACISMKLISFCVLIDYCIIGLIFVAYMCTGICNLFIMCICGKHRQLTYCGNFFDFAESYIKYYVPIRFPIPSTNCVICGKIVEENLSPWVHLKCGHKYHVACITEWVTYRKKCSYCYCSESMESPIPIVGIDPIYQCSENIV